MAYEGKHQLGDFPGGFLYIVQKPLAEHKVAAACDTGGNKLQVLLLKARGKAYSVALIFDKASEHIVYKKSEVFLGVVADEDFDNR